MKISYVSLCKIYDWSKFKELNSLNKTTMPLRSWKLKWVWQTQFLSQVLQILGKVIFFEDFEMILLSILEFFIIAKVSKNVPKLSVQVWRSLWEVASRCNQGRSGLARNNQRRSWVSKGGQKWPGMARSGQGWQSMRYTDYKTFVGRKNNFLRGISDIS